MLDKILYVFDKTGIITKICFISLHINRYNDRLLPLLRQFLLTPNRIDKIMNLQFLLTPNRMDKIMQLRANYSIPYFNKI
jgi:hypothetical protein